MTDEITNDAIYWLLGIGGLIASPFLIREAQIAYTQYLLDQKHPSEMHPWTREEAIDWARMQCDTGACYEVMSWNVLMDIYSLNALNQYLQSQPNLSEIV